MSWIYKNQIFENNDDNHFGFVYLITNLITGKKYIGKKHFYQSRTVKNKKVKAESNWRNYWSSCKKLEADVKELGTDNFTREILHLCKSSSMCSYLELREQIDRRVLETNDYYNDQIMARVNSNHIRRYL